MAATSQLCSFRFPSLPLPIPQLAPQNLPGRALRYRLDELHSALQPLIPSFMLLNISLYIPHKFFVRLTCMVCFDYKCFWNLAGSCIGDLDDCTVTHGGMSEEM